MRLWGWHSCRYSRKKSIVNFSCKIFGLLMICAMLGACKTVNSVKIDLLKLPEFIEEATQIKDFPRASDAPQLPENIPNLSVWDAHAQTLIDLRQALPPVPDQTLPASEDITLEFEIFKARVRAYKEDDPDDVSLVRP